MPNMPPERPAAGNQSEPLRASRLLEVTVPSLLMSLALFLPTTANSKGGHGGASHAA